MNRDLALLRHTLLLALTGCQSGVIFADFDTDVPDTDVPDTDVEDTDVEDTDVEDTDVEDTDVEDTDVEDTDVEDTDVEDTDTDPPTCGDAPALTQADVDTWDWSNSGGVYTVCGDGPAPGDTCPASEDFSAWVALDAYPLPQDLGPCFLDGWPVCGPIGELSDDGCCYEVQVDVLCMGGRPFTVDSRPRVAKRSRDGSWANEVDLEHAVPASLRQRLVEEWLAAAADEHASIASFSRFTMQLLAVGAPADLIAASTRATADEIAHARDCYGIASALAGETLGAGTLDIASALDGACDLETIVHGAVLEGCIGETIAAAHARAAHATATDPAIRAALARIAEDEARHAALAWRFVGWALRHNPGLAPMLDGLFRAAVASEPASHPVDPDAEALGRHGRLSKREAAGITRRVLAEVVGPCARALLAA